MTTRRRLRGLNREEPYDSGVQTLEVPSDPEFAEALRQSFADIETGRVRSLDEVARRLHLNRKPPRKTR